MSVAKLPQWGYSIPFIALGLDRVFRGCFARAFTLTVSSPQLLSYVLFVHASHSFPLFHYVAPLRA